MGRGSRNIAAQGSGGGRTTSGQAMDHLELTILGLLMAIAGLSIVARKSTSHTRSRSSWRRGHRVRARGRRDPPDPDLVLLIFLPPLSTAPPSLSNPRELKANVRWIGWLAVGLVFATTGAVAVVAHQLIGLPWSVAFVLGAVVSPTDASPPRRSSAASASPPGRHDHRGREPHERLDRAHPLSLRHHRGRVRFVSWAWAAPKVVLTGVGGIAVGCSSAWPAVGPPPARRPADGDHDLDLQRVRGVLPAEELGLSGVIAAVTVGLYMGWHSAELTTATTRMQTTGVWSTLVFLINAVLFILVGLQFPGLVRDLEGPTTASCCLGRRRERGRDRRAARLGVPHRGPAAARAAELYEEDGAPHGGSRWSSVGARCGGRFARRGARDPGDHRGGGPFPERKRHYLSTG